ncbi:uncharacterized protein LOC108110571 [Drosophila eugracilis]|uniref:uncharacterized protein LOC108110571 n=1 Tax=Drosophila eugracilis TaxID=29029 RepID=UPI001BDA3481|nr:uncharacterized protein LOC108110571 [Drosophila eugracilis]
MGIIGLLELRRYSSYIKDFLSLKRNDGPYNDPRLIHIPFEDFARRLDIMGWPPTTHEVPNNDQSGAGDGPHIRPRVTTIERPFIFFIRSRPLIYQKSWLKFMAISPMIIASLRVILRRILALFGIDVKQVFVLGLPYHAYFIIFQCLINFASNWTKEYMRGPI